MNLKKSPAYKGGFVNNMLLKFKAICTSKLKFVTEGADAYKEAREGVSYRP